MIYSLVWDDFCSWYLEWIKPGIDQEIDKIVFAKTVSFFDSLLQLLHPFMPFITEEIYHLLKEREDDLCVKQFTGFTEADDAILQQGRLLQNAITTIRDAKTKNGLKPKENISIAIQSHNLYDYKRVESLLAKAISAEMIEYVSEPITGTIVVPLSSDKLYIKADIPVNSESIKAEIEKDLTYQRNFLFGVMKKLANERFIQSAKPEIVALEKKKQSDAESRIKSLEESLAGL